MVKWVGGVGCGGVDRLVRLQTKDGKKVKVKMQDRREWRLEWQAAQTGWWWW